MKDNNSAGGASAPPPAQAPPPAPHAPLPLGPAVAGRDPSRYRANVGLALFHHAGLVFVGKRTGAHGPFQWQLPQGGIDAGETPGAAALRELEEEVGVRPDMVEVIEETSDWLYYDFPAAMRRDQGPYIGQRQKWFALRFKGRDSDIRLDLHTPEFNDWRWARLAEIPGLVIPFKRRVYEEVARRFGHLANGAPR
jgi:putative (di)nucleoside polyphosphate hydrolase